MSISVFKRPRFLKKVALFALAAIAVLYLISAILNWRFEAYFRTQIKETFSRSTDSLYVLDFSHLKVNFVLGNIRLNDVHIKLNAQRYQRRLNENKAPNNRYDLKLRQVQIKGIHLWNIFLNRKLNINNIILDHAQIRSYHKQHSYNTEKPLKPENSLYELISKDLKELSIGHIKIKNSSFAYFDENKAEKQADSIENIQLDLVDFRIDATAEQDSSRFYLFKNIILQVDNYKRLSRDGLHMLELKRLDFDALSGQMNIKDFALKPLKSEADFWQGLNVNQDRFRLQAENLSFYKISLAKLLRKQEFIAEQLSIQNGSISVVSNNALPKADNKPYDFPQQSLKKLPFKFGINEIKLQDVHVRYAELNQKNEQRGTINFDHMKGKIAHVSNMPDRIAQNPLMEADLQSSFLGITKLHTRFTFDMQDPQAGLSFEGALGNLNARAINQMSRPLGLIHIKQGVIDSLWFKFKANIKGSEGDLKLRYHNLAIAVLKYDADNGQLVRQGILSLLTNQLIIHPANPLLGEKPIDAHVQYSRLPNTSFFNLLWRSIYLGTKHSIGITPAKTKSMEGRIKTFKKMKKNLESL